MLNLDPRNQDGVIPQAYMAIIQLCYKNIRELYFNHTNVTMYIFYTYII